MTTLRVFDAAGDGFDFVEFTRNAAMALDIAANGTVTVTRTSSLISIEFPFSSFDADVTTVRIDIFGSFDDIESTGVNGPISQLDYLADGVRLIEYVDLDLDIADYFDGTPAAVDAFSSFTFIGSSNDDVVQQDGLGPHTLNGAGGADHLIGSDGADVINGDGGGDTMTGGAGADMIDGGAGLDTVDYGAETGLRAIDINLSTGRAVDASGVRDTLVSIENVTGGERDDRLFGDEAANVLTGGAGDDVFNAKGGDDTIYGGLGEDGLTGGAGDDRLYGEDGDDVLGGRSGDDLLNGGDGDDRIFGQLGDDVIIAGAGDDVVNGGLGQDDITAGAGDDRVLARDGDDTVSGGAGDDRLNGGTGEDRLNGGAGDDTLIGGAEADTFVYDAANFGDDRLLRFNPNLDIIEIDTAIAADFGALTVTQDESNAIISFGGGTVTLVSRDSADITAADFMFV